MNKQTRMISLLVIGMMIFSMAAVASADVLTLQADVPEGKTLKAYKFTLTYDASKVKVTGTKALLDGFSNTVNDKTAGTIIVNGFMACDDADANCGVKGAAAISVLEVTVDGSAQDANFSYTVDDFGFDTNNRFEDKANPKLVVK